MTYLTLALHILAQLAAIGVAGLIGAKALEALL